MWGREGAAPAAPTMPSTPQCPPPLWAYGPQAGLQVLAMGYQDLGSGSPIPPLSCPAPPAQPWYLLGVNWSPTQTGDRDVFGVTPLPVLLRTSLPGHRCPGGGPQMGLGGAASSAPSRTAEGLRDGMGREGMGWVWGTSASLCTGVRAHRWLLAPLNPPPTRSAGRGGWVPAGVLPRPLLRRCPPPPPDEPTSPSIDLKAKHVPASSVVSSAMNSAPAVAASPSSPTFAFALSRHYSQDCSTYRWLNWGRGGWGG